MSASSIPCRCVDHEPQESGPEIAPARTSHATAPCCLAPSHPAGFARRRQADAPISWTAPPLCRPSRPIALSGRHHTANGTPEKSIEPRAPPYHRPARVQSNRVSVAATRPKNSYFVRLRSPLSTMPAGIIVPTFPQLTTTDFDRSSLRWLGISDLIAEPEGSAFISSTVTQCRLDRRYS
jgi:hypothetical protein